MTGRPSSKIREMRRQGKIPAGPESGTSHAQFKHLLSLFGHGARLECGGGLGSPYGEPQMKSILNEVILFSCVGALFVGIVLTAASLVG
jgi:hypothetical protein